MRVSPRSLPTLALALLVFAPLATGCEAAVSLSGLEGGCPRKPGASLVKITSGDRPFCIDSTEATNAEYAQFLASGFTLNADKIPDGCADDTDHTPSDHWPPAPGYDDFPVQYVDWCQASAYCAWTGKRLCGAIDGGPLAATNFTNAKVSQWLCACSDHGATTYPYGNDFDANACAGSDLSIVASHPACVGSVSGLYDMSGNVWEWTDTCASSDPTAFCDAMGGAFDSVAADFPCAGERNWTRTASSANIGFRCCLDL